jgi:inner membrane protein
MDTLTHALSGALVARLLVARRVPQAATVPAPAPWQAVVCGLVAGAFPDIDFVAQAFGDLAYLTQHRGITHSVLLLPLWAAGLAWLLSRAFAGLRGPGGWQALFPLVAAGIGIHIAGDWITQFGTMLLQPLSDRRFGLGAVFIIDLVLTGTLLAGLALAAAFPRARWPAALGLAAATAWVGVAWTGQQEAIAVGERQARALGIAAPEIVVMPRPASPFNWTISVFDGTVYHVAHVNTRRTRPLVAGPDANFLRRFSAPYAPADQASWETVPRFADARAPGWVNAAWQAPAFGFFRWFAQTPALLAWDDGAHGRCAWFHDLRFMFPGRVESPFQFGVCQTAGSPPRLFRLEGGRARPLQ